MIRLIRIFLKRMLEFSEVIFFRIFQYSPGILAEWLRFPTLVKAALPREAKVILYSTRHPCLIENLDRDSQSSRILIMKGNEMASLIIATIRRIGGIFSNAAMSEEELEAIARVLNEYALGACRAIPCILHVFAQTTTDESPAGVFLDMFNGPQWESRLQFLEYKPRTGLSIM